ncbi:hypothetical protein DFH11DRAFT_98479 [Phellopilus nigrolimitatus]|nr:hypothetical protein DFH11DRAFT_98479 [Phellopilus nigrolimitatus]
MASIQNTSSNLIRLDRTSVITFSKEALHAYRCDWGACPTTLNSWQTLKAHISLHCKRSKEHSCGWKKCAFPTHSSHEALIAHVEMSHLSRLPLSCPLQDCDSFFIRHQVLPDHLLEAHSGLAYKWMEQHKSSDVLRHSARLQLQPTGSSGSCITLDKLPKEYASFSTTLLPISPSSSRAMTTELTSSFSQKSHIRHSNHHRPLSQLDPIQNKPLVGQDGGRAGPEEEEEELDCSLDALHLGHFDVEAAHQDLISDFSVKSKGKERSTDWEACPENIVIIWPRHATVSAGSELSNPPPPVEAALPPWKRPPTRIGIAHLEELYTPHNLQSQSHVDVGTGQLTRTRQHVTGTAGPKVPINGILGDALAIATSNATN